MSYGVKENETLVETPFETSAQSESVTGSENVTPSETVSHSENGAAENVRYETLVVSESSEPADLSRVEGMFLILLLMFGLLLGTLYSNIFFKRGGD